VIHWETRDGIGVATIDRPERRNALNAELCEQLSQHLAGDPSLRAVVIGGAGGTFCAGADIGGRFGGDEASHGGDTFRPSFETALQRVVDYPAPVIAAMAGPTLGAGLQLAVACDLRVASPDATLGIPAGRLGVHLSAPNLARLGQLVGQGVARDLLLGSRVLRGNEALACGLVHRVVGDPLAAATEWANEIATLAPLTLAGHKRALNLLAAAPYDADALAEIAQLERQAFDSEDLREGMAAFAEKRRADFKGR